MHYLQNAIFCIIFRTPNAKRNDIFLRKSIKLQFGFLVVKETRRTRKENCDAN